MYGLIQKSKSLKTIKNDEYVIFITETLFCYEMVSNYIKYNIMFKIEKIQYYY